jgi:predicted amidophosphoribosyltransferase
LTSLGKVIDVEFRPGDRGRWCVRCDEPFPEGTALCPRCGGELSSAARHRAEARAAARHRVQRAAAAGGISVAAMIAALVIWLVLR